jgi:Cof subfamily protein (haloacid dehalogenase superfamily)
MKYKMLVIDMDDTLLTDDHKISEENKEMLFKAQEKGLYVILASGRPTPAMTAYAKELKMDNSYMISYNGAVITDLKEDKVIFEQTLTQEQIHELYEYSLKSKTHIITYLDGKVVSETNSEYIDIELNITGLVHNKVLDFKAAVTSSAVKCILLEEPSYLKEVEKDLKLALFERKHVKAFFSGSGTKWDRQSGKYKNIGRETGYSSKRNYRCWECRE